jgi:4-amino-4-deoxy-L-arabinose transferase-like glycosyltransferase
MNPPAASRWDYEVRVMAWLAVCVSVVSFLFYFRRGDVLLYGDAVAHINIARRVFDSQTPGLLQLGTVWLPLPHLLMIPFLISDDMWQRGVGGSIPSLVAYVLGVVGMFRLVRGVLSRKDEPTSPAHVAAWMAALVYGANPNLIYMQATAMGDAVYLAFFIWAVVYLSEFARGGGNALWKFGVCLTAACLTRYDGWFLAAGMAGAVLVAHLWKERKGNDGAHMFSGSPQLVRFVLIAAAAPVFWLGYNAAVYRNPLEFENGPYSAKAIEKKTQNAGSVGHPGSGNLYVAGLYFLKSAEASLAENGWLQRVWVLLLVAGFVAIGFDFRDERKDRALSAGARSREDGAPRFLTWMPLAFLLTPLPFYALSVAYGGVPIFIPEWWPFSHYNARYGLQLLPAFAAAVAGLVYVALRFHRWNQKLRATVVFALIALVVASYASIWRAGPMCLAEAQINMRGRVALQRQLAGWLKALPSDSTLLMYLGGYPGAVQEAGIPLRRVINEGNHRVWKHPVDPEGLWERALADPAKYADYALAFEGDSVWQAAQGKHLRELVEIKVSGEPRAILYRLR